MKRKIQQVEFFMKRLLRKHEAKHTLSPPYTEGVLHGAKPRIIFHAPKVCFIEKSTSFEVLFSGLPGAIRTHDLQSRSLTLYPAELRVVISVFILHIIAYFFGFVKGVFDEFINYLPLGFVYLAIFLSLLLTNI